MASPPSSSAPRRYRTLLHLISTSPRFPANLPSMYSSVDASCRFMYASVDTKNPLYSMPHFSLTMIGLPVSWLRNGLGLTGTVAAIVSASLGVYSRGLATGPGVRVRR
uniref:Uncharacterized protein n=1 Tax=Micromonas pusilla TaxID=38833 RepID=A0A7S0KJZ2_MICPS